MKKKAMTEKSSPFLYTKFTKTEFISYELKNTALESYCFSDNSDIVKLLADVNQGSIARFFGGENELALGRITENIPQNPLLNQALRYIWLNPIIFSAMLISSIALFCW